MKRAKLKLYNSTELKSVTKSFMKDKVKSSNVIVDLLKNLESTDIKELRGGLAGVHRIFSLLLKDGDIKDIAEINVKAEDLLTSKDKYNLWLSNRYSEVFLQLFKLLVHQMQQIQELSFQVIIRLIQKESQFPLTKKKGKNFPLEKLQTFFTTLFNEEKCRDNTVKHVFDYMLCEDFMFYSLKCMANIVANDKVNIGRESYQSRFLSILEIVNLKEELTKSLVPKKYYIYPMEESEAADENIPPPFVVPYKEARDYLNQIWEALLSWPLTESSCKKCLIILPEKVMMHLNEPFRLTDFFMGSYERGGASGLMALHGMFILITKYNVEYPNFYAKLYTMLEPRIFQKRFRPRFFILLAKFLSSSHLPQYIMMAFTKQLSRLLLVAPSSCLVLLLKFIINLLVENPGLRILINNSSGMTLEDDPFLPNEKDFNLCNAHLSSLWEVETLRHHPLPSVFKAANFIERNLSQIRLDLTKHVEDTYEDLYERCSKISLPEVSTTFVKMDSLFKHPDDEMSCVWSLHN